MFLIQLAFQADCGMSYAMQIKTKGLEVDFDLSNGSIRNVQIPGGHFISKGKGGVYFIDGSTGKVLFPSEIHVDRVSERSIEYTVKKGLDGAYASVDLSWSENIILWKVEIENRDRSTRFFEVRLGLPVVAAKTLEYWDGYDGNSHGYPDDEGGIIQPRMREATQTSNMLAHASNSVLSRPGADLPVISMPNLEPAMLSVFPLNLLFGSESGIALGADPGYLMSYYAGGVQPTFSSHESFYYSLKYVVQPWKRVRQGFVLFSFRPDGFGYRPALARYYEAFPEKFGRREGLNPKALKVGSGLHKGQMEINDLWMEYSRRHRLGYVWYYTGHERTGEFWPEMNDRGTEKDSSSRVGEFVKQVQKGCMVAYYTIPQRCEINLANTRFFDSQVRTNDGRPLIKGKVLKDETLVTMYPWGNRYGNHLKEDLARIVEEGGAEALAFDNAFAADFHFGPGLEKSEGIAFDNLGPIAEDTDSISASDRYNPLAYAPVYIGYANLMDYLKERFDSQGKKVAFIGNGPRALATATRCDASYLEWHWKPHLKRVGFFQAQRYLLGGMRPISYKIAGRWMGGEDRIAPEEHNKIRHERKFSLLHLFRYGGYPVMRKHMGAGDPDCLAALPTLEKLCKAGWMPVSGVRHDDALWVERFGNKEKVYLSVINPTSSYYTGSVKVENSYLGKGYRWFAPQFGEQGKVTCRSRGGNTNLGVSVPATWVQVFESSLEIFHTDAEAIIEGWFQVATEKMTVNINTDRPGSLKLKAFLPEGAYEAKAALKDGIPIKCSLKGNVLILKINKIPMEIPVELIITWKDAFHLANRQQIMDFPFFKGEQPNCEIITQEGYIEVARRLQLYFDYWHLQRNFTAWLQGDENALQPIVLPSYQIPIVSFPTNGNRHMIFIGDHNFAREQADLCLNKSLAFPKAHIAKPMATAISGPESKVLFIALSNTENDPEILVPFLNALDKSFPTSPGYDANYKRQRAWDEKDYLYKPFPGQPVYGWSEFLKYLQEKYRN